jgi:hypothetical protein
MRCLFNLERGFGIITHFSSSSSTIFRAEGPRGLVRGMDAAILRTSMGSSVRGPHLFSYPISSCIGAITELQSHQKLLGEPRHPAG